MVNSLSKKLTCMVLSVIMFLSIFTIVPTADKVNAATSAPTGLKINEYSSSAAKISWSKVSGATGYIVYRSTNGSDFSKLKILSSSSISYTNTGLASGSSYWYKVASYQTLNGKTSISSTSSAVKLTTTTSKSVSIPKNFNVTEYSDAAVKLTWTAASGVTGYYVYRSTDGSRYSKIKDITSASTTAYTNVGLSSDKKYYYLIASYKKSSNGTIAIGPKQSNPLTITTTSATSVPAPKNFKITEYSASAIKLSWTKASGVTGYYIYRSTNGGSYTKIKDITSSNTTTYTNGNLGAGKKYCYKIASYKKSSNTKIAIGPKSSTIAEAKTTSKTVTVTGTSSTSTSIKITWNKISDAAGYQILRLDTSTNTYSKIYTASASTTSYTDKNLSSNTKYSYKIRAYYKSGNTVSYSPYTSVSAKTDSSGLTGLTIDSASGSSVTLKWTAASGASGYQIYMLSSNGKYELLATVASNVTSYTIGFLSPSTKYSFKVRACYTNGSSTTYGEYATIEVTTPAANREITMADEIFTLINNERKKAGIRLLQHNDEITAVAQLRAVEISEKFGETRPNGKNWDTVLDDAELYRWRYIGELRSRGFLNSSSVVSDWMDDTASKNQILDEKVTDLGVGVYYKGNTPYYVAFFYRPLD